MDFIGGVGRFFRNLFRRGPANQKPEDYELPKYTFCDTMEEFGYHFSDKGELVNKTGGRFEFHIKDDLNYNQQHYDALGDLITEYLYDKMQTDLKLQKVFIPVNRKGEEPQGFIFQSSDAAENGTLMVILNGAGNVRAGQWSRKLIINDSIEKGTMFPYIQRAQAEGYAVMLLNTNQNQVVVDGKVKEIRGSGTPEEHGLYVWEHIISKTKAANIVIVAHSYGGLVTCKILEKFLKDMKRRVFCIVFTDSIHMTDRDQWSQPVKDFLKERVVNFASTYVPLDYIMEASSPDDCMSVSAGTKEHELTSHSCIDSAFQFIRANHATWTRDGFMAVRHFKPLPQDLSAYDPGRRWRLMEAEEAVEAKEEAAMTTDAQEESSAAKNGGGQDQGRDVTETDEFKASGQETVVEPEKQDGGVKNEEAESKHTVISPETAEEARCEDDGKEDQPVENTGSKRDDTTGKKPETDNEKEEAVNTKEDTESKKDEAENTEDKKEESDSEKQETQGQQEGPESQREESESEKQETQGQQEGPESQREESDSEKQETQGQQGGPESQREESQTVEDQTKGAQGGDSKKEVSDMTSQIGQGEDQHDSKQEPIQH